MTYPKDELLPEICQRLARGETLASICRDPHMPDRDTVYLWSSADPEVSRQIAQARATGFDAIADECMEIADDAAQDHVPSAIAEGATVFNAEHVQRSKLRIETRLKLLAKWDPKRYGERQAIEHSVNEDTAAILSGARKRAGVGG